MKTPGKESGPRRIRLPKAGKASETAPVRGTAAKAPAVRPPARSTVDSETIPLERQLGTVIRRLRVKSGLTLAELSEGAGISSGMLSRIETGNVMASLDTLRRLSRAVGVDLSTLFRETERGEGHAQLIKATDQMEVVRSGTRHGHTYRLLSYDRGPKKKFEPFLIEMDRESEIYPRFQHPGTEFIYMMEGRMDYRFGDRTYLLEPGDAFTFSGEVEHGPEKLHVERTIFLSIIIYDEDAG
ncbi:helix-turn-helix domain-containing protein [Zavarzinia sp.]|uniref:helix-turn-helix domain-containing protein n=1 Tax=Zavarzinia sp. TaxID=2027920 RepID=UPI00356142DF